MNSIDAYDKAFELLLAARYNSDNIHFNWEKWESDVDALVRSMNYSQEPKFHAYRNAIKYTIDGLPVDKAVNLLPNRTRDGDKG